MRCARAWVPFAVLSLMVFAAPGELNAQTVGQSFGWYAELVRFDQAVYRTQFFGHRLTLRRPA